MVEVGVREKQGIFGKIRARFLPDKRLTNPENKGENPLNQLEQMATRLTDLWEDKTKRDRFTEDEDIRAKNGWKGNYQNRTIKYLGQDIETTFSSWSGYPHKDHWGTLNQVEGHVDAGEIPDMDFPSAGDFNIDIETPFYGPNKSRTMAKVTLSGSQLLTPEWRKGNINQVEVSHRGLEAHLNDSQAGLNFEDRTDVDIRYIAGTREQEGRATMASIVSPEGPIQELRLSIGSLWNGRKLDKEHIEVESKFITMKRDSEGLWEQELSRYEEDEDWGGILSAETLPDGSVNIHITSSSQEKVVNLPKIDLKTVMAEANKLVEAIVA